MIKNFNGDYELTLMWFATKHPLLGNTAPLIMIALGRTEKLCKFIESYTDGLFP